MPPEIPRPMPAKAPTVAHVQQNEPAADLSSAPSRFVPASIDEVMKTARMFYDGGLMARHFYEDKRIHPDHRRSAGIAGVATMILYGAELGISPAQAMRTMHVIEGRAVLSSAGMVALIKRSPKCHYFRVEEASDEHCVVETQRRLDDGKLDKPRRITVRIWWGDPKDVPTAQKDTAHVLPSRDRDGKPTSPWARTPMRMLKARACSWVANDVYEDVITGLYSAEEIVDFRDNRTQAAMVDNIFDMVAVPPASVPDAGTTPRFEREDDDAGTVGATPTPSAPAADPVAAIAKQLVEDIRVAAETGDASLWPDIHKRMAMVPTGPLLCMVAEARTLAWSGDDDGKAAIWTAGSRLEGEQQSALKTVYNTRKALLTELKAKREAEGGGA
jgi:hypothetical protein